MYRLQALLLLLLQNFSLCIEKGSGGDCMRGNTSRLVDFDEKLYVEAQRMEDLSHEVISE